MCGVCICVGGGIEGEVKEREGLPSPGALSVHPGCALSLFVMSSKPAGRHGSFIALYPAACC